MNHIHIGSQGSPSPEVQGLGREADHSSPPVRLNGVHKDNNYGIKTQTALHHTTPLDRGAWCKSQVEF